MKLTVLPAAIVMLTLSATLSWAQQPQTLTGEMKDPSFAQRVNALFGKGKAPDWLKTSTDSPSATVKMDGKPYTVLLACKSHDCANQQFAVMFDKDAMYGLRLEAKAKGQTQKLTWLNIGDGPESIDGKTILFAAMTGSLYNHPEVFNAP